MEPTITSTVRPTHYHKLLSLLLHQGLIWTPLVLGMGWLVIRPIGLHFSVMPGNYGDTRLINYILEHFYRWASGLEPAYWSPRMFYPFPLTLAFSDNLLGSGPFYALFRLFGLDREMALQGWYILGFGLNYLAAAFVLHKLRFHPLAVGMGAFFFTFSLPALAQIGHLQLLYRFCVPLAVYLLWRFADRARLWYLAGILVLLAWQLWNGIYLGVFLGILLAVMALLLPFTDPGTRGWKNIFAYWPERLQTAWNQSGTAGRLLVPGAAILFIASTAALFMPYIQVTQLYQFNRSWAEVLSMLPRPQSYLIADHTPLWQPVSKHLGGVTMRHEHQLFLGIFPLALLIVGTAARFSTRQRPQARNAAYSVAVLFILTLVVGGVSLYYLIWLLPGMDSIRSVTRFQLVWLWPLAVFLAYAADGMLARAEKKPMLAFAAVLLAAGLLLEPAAVTYYQRYSTRHARERLAQIRAQLPAEIPDDPILFLADRPDESEVVSEVDAMMLAQELGWATFNGYSGNEPPGYQPAQSCAELPRRILNYLELTGKTDQSAYLAYMKRAVPVGFTDCDPGWWQAMPSLATLQP